MTRSASEPATQDVYESVLARVNEQQPVDFDALEDEHPDLATEWRKLRRVQEIAGAFQAAQGTDSEVDEASAECLPTASPSVWGSLEVGVKIGEGTFGEVFRAHDPALRRDVALKLARGESPSQRRRFLSEGRLMAQVRHPGVVQVYGAAVHDGRAGVWMDLAEGRALDRRLEEDGRFSEREVVDTLRQLTDALAAVHSAGMVHGDIKSANVLRRDGGEVLLGDFGSSLDLSEGSREVGSASPLSAAPEVLRGEPADHRSDIYSLGILGYHLLTNSYPYEAKTARELERIQRTEDPTGLRRRRPEISAATAAVIEKASAVAPDQRWQDASALSDALGELDTGEPSGVKQFSPRAVLSLLAVGSLLVLGIWWMGSRSAALVHTGRAGDDGPTLAGGSSRGSHASVADASAPLAPSSAAADRSNESDVFVSLFRTGSAEPLRNGNSIALGDALHAKVFGHQEPLWVYLVNEDAEGRVYTLFPLHGLEPSNPLPPGDYRLPGALTGAQQDWVVTSKGRIESFLLVSSSVELPQLDAALDRLDQASADRTVTAKSASGVTRGVGGLETTIEGYVPDTLRELLELVGQDGQAGIASARIVTLRGAVSDR